MENRKDYIERLTYEAIIKQHPVELDADGGLEKGLKKEIKKLKKDMDDEEYKAWKEAYLEEEYSKVKDMNWITISYMYIGIGDYTSTVPMEQKGCIMNMINHSGSAIYTGEREAFESEIKLAIAMSAAQQNSTSEETEKTEAKKTEVTSSPVAMRWGYDGGGMACGPVEGNTITEIMFRDKEGKSYFVSATRMSEFINLYVSEVSLYDILFNMGGSDANMEAEMQKLEKYSTWMAETELGGYDYIEESTYPEELKMVICANDYHYKNEPSQEEAEIWLEGVMTGKIKLNYPEMDGEDF